MIIDYLQGEYEQGQVYFDLGHIDSISTITSVVVEGVFEVIKLILNNSTLKYDLENDSTSIILNNYTIEV